MHDVFFLSSMDSKRFSSVLRCEVTRPIELPNGHHALMVSCDPPGNGQELGHPLGAGPENVNRTLLLPDRIEEAIEVLEVCCVASKTCDRATDLGDGSIEYILPTSHDEHVRALLDEELRPGQGHPARRAGDDCDLPIELARLSEPRPSVPC